MFHMILLPVAQFCNLSGFHCNVSFLVLLLHLDAYDNLKMQLFPMIILEEKFLINFGTVSIYFDILMMK